MESMRLFRIIPNCYHPVQDKDGLIHFVDEDDILVDYEFAEGFVCSQCWCRKSEGCEEELTGKHCMRYEIVDNVRLAIRLLNAAMTDLTFGNWVGLFEGELKKARGGIEECQQ